MAITHIWVNLGDYDNVFVARDMISIACDREGGYGNKTIGCLRDVIELAHVDSSDVEAVQKDGLFDSVVFGLLQVLPCDKSRSTAQESSFLIICLSLLVFGCSGLLKMESTPPRASRTCSDAAAMRVIRDSRRWSGGILPGREGRIRTTSFTSTVRERLAFPRKKQRLRPITSLRLL